MRKNFKFLILSLVALLVLSCGVVFLAHDFSVQKNDVEQTEQDCKVGESNAWFVPMPRCYDSAHIYSYREATSQSDSTAGYDWAGWLCMWHDHKGGLQYNDYFRIYLNGGYYLKSFKFNVRFNGNHNFTITQSSPDANPSISWSTLYGYKVSLDRSANLLGGWTYTVELNGHNSSTYIESNTGIKDDEYYLTHGSQIDGRIHQITLSGNTSIYEKYRTGFYSDSAATSSISSITPPTKAGYIFGGYFSANDGEGTKYINADGSFTSDLHSLAFKSAVTLYPAWKEGDFEISLYPSGANNAGTTSIYQKGTNFYLDTAHTKLMQNYTKTITVWVGGDPEEIAINEWVIGHYEERTVTVKTNPIEIPEKKGYIFDGYFTTSSGGTQYIDENGYICQNVSAFSNETTLYAHWTMIRYELGPYDLNRGDSSTTPSYGDKHPTDECSFTKEIEISNPTMPGYTFKGWTFDGDTDTAEYYIKTTHHSLLLGLIKWDTDEYGRWSSQTTPIKSPGSRYRKLASTQGAIVHLTANWEANSYNIVFNANKPTNMSTSVTQTFHVYNSDGTSYASEEYTNTPQTMRSFVTFDKNVNNRAIAQANGWTFNGYYTEASGGKQLFDANGTIVKGVSEYTDSSGRWIRKGGATLYAHWTANNYNITFDTNKPSNMSSAITQVLNGSNYTSSNQAMTNFVTFDSAVSKTAKAIVNPAGWTFNGYYTAATDGSQVFDANGNIVSSIEGYTSSTGTWIKASDTTLYAQWTPHSYGISLELNGGTINPNTTSFTNRTYDDTITNIPNPTKTGYTFAGWTMGGGNTSTAKYGTSNNSVTTTWSNASTKVKATYFKNLTPTNDATVRLHANWTKNQYTISYNLNGGTHGSNHQDSATYDDAFQLSNPTRTGYTFTGWNITGMDSVTHTYGSNTSTATSLNKVTVTTFKNLRSTSGTVTFTATWDANVYSLTLDNQSATTAGTTTIYEKYADGFYKTGNTTTRVVSGRIGTNLNSIPVPTRTGYTFHGYYTSQNGGGTKVITETGYLATSVSPTLFTSNSTLSPYWIINQYTITLQKKLIDGTNETILPYKTITQDYATAIAAEANPTQEGYTFTGWSETIPATMPSQNKTIYANFTINSYTMSFVVFNGDASLETTYSVTQKYGTTVIPPDQDDSGYTVTPSGDPNRESFHGYLNYKGYAFINWDSAIPETMPASENTYYASLLADPSTANTITYTFKGLYKDGGVEYEKTFNRVTINGVNPQAYNGTTAEFTLFEPAVTGYTFLGWKGTDLSDYTKIVTINPALTGGNKEYVGWFKRNSYTLNIEWMEGSTDNLMTTTQEYETTIPEQDSPTPRRGYTFTGWSDIIPTKMPAHDTTIHACWVANRYTINLLDSVTNELIDSITEDYDVVLNIVNPDKLGYTFTGWTMTNGSTQTARYGNSAASCNSTWNNPTTNKRMETWFKNLTFTDGAVVTLNANFTINQYTLTFMFGDQVHATINEDYNTEIVVPNTPDYAGYTFLGWDNEIPERMPAENLTFNALRETNVYDIIYYLPSENIVNNNPTTYSVESDDIILEDLSWEGYTFLGWTYVGQSEPTKEVTIEQGSIGDKEFTACFEAIVYTITKHIDGQDYTEQYTIESDTYTIENPTKLGYEFTGWSGTGIDDLAMEVTIENGSMGDREFTAHFEVIIYTITYQLNNGVVDGENPTEYTVNSEDITLINPTKVGFTFLGWTWQDQYDPALEVTIEHGSTENRSFVAIFQVNKYTIRLVDDDNTIIEITQEYGSSVASPIEPTKEGYTFTGWSTEIPQSMGAEDVVITATFTPIVYRIMYILDEGIVDGENPEEYTIESGDITIINPTREGYIFNGWYEYEGEKPSTDYTIKHGSTGDKLLMASWTKVEDNKTPIIIGASLAGAALIAGAVGVGLSIAKRKKRLV